MLNQIKHLTQKLNKVLVASVLISVLLPTTIMAKEVVNRTDPATTFNKQVFEKLNSYPMDRTSIGEPVRKFNIAIQYKGQDKPMPYTDKMSYTIKVSNNKSMISLVDMSNILDTPISWFNNHRIAIIGDFDTYVQFSNHDGVRPYVKLVYIPINRMVAQKDDERVVLDVPPTIHPVENRTYIPIRKISELWGFNVDYDVKTNTIILIER